MDCPRHAETQLRDKGPEEGRRQPGFSRRFLHSPCHLFSEGGSKTVERGFVRGACISEMMATRFQSPHHGMHFSVGDEPSLLLLLAPAQQSQHQPKISSRTASKGSRRVTQTWRFCRLPWASCPAGKTAYRVVHGQCSRPLLDFDVIMDSASGDEGLAECSRDGEELEIIQFPPCRLQSADAG